jgi:hypothetical protein
MDTTLFLLLAGLAGLVGLLVLTKINTRLPRSERNPQGRHKTC